MRVILQRIYQFRNQFSYFYKSDDDTFSIIENLKHELANHNPDDPFMNGHRWHLRIPGGYFSGGAGHVLPREALKRIVEKAIFKHPKCHDTDEAMEDVKMSICGSAVGVKRIDLLDEKGESLFCPSDIKYPFDNYKPEPQLPVDSEPFFDANE
ncbi:putative core 1 udp-galactose:n-acetylgalactosamine-alpha-r beta 1 3-galactosyltransferase [Fasciola gigantica]|uniref:Putative core 1 udp-galactose:n-acetylgalactosamine-alpha-r beta 1 3-galactosyltransferase n=1 Tax=Fasciola gigantica TaxID=46835 RepID=A0A504Z281_FASGI|nr:putative core 1 udp-galactose:n-acetylgalactosamine-alpha-r beta 1 3-galactosyltransferase [Fasciola gigantica]